MIELEDRIDLEEILEKLIEIPEFQDTSLDSLEIASFFELFEKLYSDHDYRHSYYEISKFIEQQDPEVRTALSTNLEIILKNAYEKNKSKHLIKGLLKLTDHVSLETLRLARMDTVKYISDKITNDVSKAKEDVSKTKDDVEEQVKQITDTKEKLNSVQTELVTILGVFAGIVVGFSTSFQLLAQSFAHLDDVHFHKMIAYLCVIGVIMFDSIFLLLFAVARVSKRSLALRCKKEECSKCKNDYPCKNTFRQVQKKYPYVIWFNIIMLIVFTICCIYGFLI